jgi:hypothetical protein
LGMVDQLYHWTVTMVHSLAGWSLSVGVGMVAQTT